MNTKETDFILIQTAITEIANAQDNLKDISALSNLVNNATEEIQNLKSNWSTDGGLEICNSTLNQLDINTNSLINIVQDCANYDIRVTTENREHINS